MKTPSKSYPLKLFVIIGLCFVLIFFLLAGLGLGLNYWWRGRPEYSLNQIGVAVRTHDLFLFRKHVDMKSVSERLIDDLMNANSGSAEPGQALGQAFVGLMKPRITELFEEQTERFVETGSFTSENAQSALPKLRPARHYKPTRPVRLGHY